MKASKKPQKPQKKLSDIKFYAKYSSMALQMMVIIALGTFGGYMIDNWIDWRFPLFTLLLSLFSVGMAIYIFIKDLL